MCGEAAGSIIWEGLPMDKQLPLDKQLPRGLTDEETKVVSGGAPGGNGTVPWSNFGGVPLNGPDNNWRDNK